MTPRSPGRFHVAASHVSRDELTGMMSQLLLFARRQCIMHVFQHAMHANNNMNAPLIVTSPENHPHVPETAFGIWFLQTHTWTLHVLERAFKDLETLIVDRLPSYPVVADVGCGWPFTQEAARSLCAATPDRHGYRPGHAGSRRKRS